PARLSIIARLRRPDSLRRARPALGKIDPGPATATADPGSRKASVDANAHHEILLSYGRQILPSLRKKRSAVGEASKDLGYWGV
ncbi:MAG: hypothetical protein PVJ32_09575, partial [Anaerolineales bacterium]